MGFVLCDISPEAVLANAAVMRMLNGTPGKKLSWTLAEIDEALNPAVGLLNHVRTCLQEDRAVELNQVHCGELVLRLLITPMSNPSKGKKQRVGAVVLVEDTTEQTVAERSKDEFFIASHELRTPLTAIRGNTSLITRCYKDKINDRLVTDMIVDIHDSSVRLIQIVNDFLDVSALEQGKIQMRPEDFQLEPVANEVLRDLATVANAKGDKLTVDTSLAAVPVARADRQHIKQVIYNLVGNAIKFTVKGTVTVGGSYDGRLVHCWVKDTGLGMSEDSHKLLFRKFQQVGTNLLNRDNTKGTGLGLYISKLIVELSGGSVTLEQSQPQTGSTFSFSLPAAKPAKPKG